MWMPEFWRHDGAAARLLTPAAWLYDAGRRLVRLTVTPRQVERPVVCVGNLVAGGAGKTPTALAVAKLLLAQGRRPHFISRGYGGRMPGPLRVDAERHDAREVGDEALLLALRAPTWVGRDRVSTARLAIESGADCLVLDDGFQNPRLAKDLSLVVVDAGFGFGNGRLLPAGPLREPIRTGLARADAVVLIEAPLAPLEAVPAELALPRDKPLLLARLAPVPPANRLVGARAVAFAGIARPEKFFETLTALGVEVLEAHRFADHHQFDAAEIMHLVEGAAAKGARLLTTAKDHVRLPAEARAMVEVLEVELEFKHPELIGQLLQRLFADA